MLVAHGHTVLVLLNLLCQLINPFVIAIQEEFHVAGMVCIGKPQGTSHFEDKGVHHVGDIAVVGQQHPTLRLFQSQQFMLSVELYTVRLFVIPQERAVAATTNGSTSRIVGKRSTGTLRDEARHIVLLGSDGSTIGSSDVQLEHAIRILVFRVRSSCKGEAVNDISAEG